ncbi:unnamed protein product [Pedinophyceae sp. YPF-701]|nr:unnamed protein product [Pedinophyceae sp. YPF-701]
MTSATLRGVANELAQGHFSRSYDHYVLAVVVDATEVKYSAKDPYMNLWVTDPTILPLDGSQASSGPKKVEVRAFAAHDRDLPGRCVLRAGDLIFLHKFRPDQHKKSGVPGPPMLVGGWKAGSAMVVFSGEAPAPNSSGVPALKHPPCVNLKIRNSGLFPTNSALQAMLQYSRSVDLSRIPGDRLTRLCDLPPRTPFQDIIDVGGEQAEPVDVVALVLAVDKRNKVVWIWDSTDVLGGPDVVVDDNLYRLPHARRLTYPEAHEAGPGVDVVDQWPLEHGSAVPVNFVGSWQQHDVQGVPPAGQWARFRTMRFCVADHQVQGIVSHVTAITPANSCGWSLSNATASGGGPRPRDANIPETAAMIAHGQEPGELTAEQVWEYNVVNFRTASVHMDKPFSRVREVLDSARAHLHDQDYTRRFRLACRVVAAHCDASAPPASGEDAQGPAGDVRDDEPQTQQAVDVLLEDSSGTLWAVLMARDSDAAGGGEGEDNPRSVSFHRASVLRWAGEAGAAGAHPSHFLDVTVQCRMLPDAEGGLRPRYVIVNTVVVGLPEATQDRQPKRARV